MDDCGGVVFVPALAGLGAPHWDPEARGLVAGLTRGSTAAHIARAALEGIAFQINDILTAMRADLEQEKTGTGNELLELKVDGGASNNNLLMQFQSDILGVPIVRPKMLETTALGAGLLAGLATGVWSSRMEAASAWQADRHFEPTMDAADRDEHLARWDSALRRA